MIQFFQGIPGLGHSSLQFDNANHFVQEGKLESARYDIANYLEIGDALCQDNRSRFTSPLP